MLYFIYNESALKKLKNLVFNYIKILLKINVCNNKYNGFKKIVFQTFTKINCVYQLGQGVLIKVQSNLIKRSKNHFHNLSAGVSVILGNNGYVWIEPTNDQKDAAGFEVDLQQVNII